MRRKLLSLVLVLNVSFAFAQEQRTRREVIPIYPDFTGELIDTVKKPKPDSVRAGELASSSFAPYMNPSAPPEAARANALGNIPVNLYTGSPVINLPIYTLTEGRLNLPLYMNYSHSVVKPTAVAGWTGLGFDLAGVPTLSRMIRGFPDEGYLEYDGSNFHGQKGYYFWGHSFISSDKKQDKEPDYFFVNTPSGSAKFVFDRYANAHFFPEADIKVNVTHSNVPEGGGVVRKFTQFKITFPDGITYYFSSAATEESAEIDAKFAKDNGIYPYPFNSNPAPFLNFVKQGMIPSAWSCVKMESPYGEKIDFTYQKVAYTYYRLGESEANQLCPVGGSSNINKVYVRSSLLSSIKTSSIEVNFNTGYQTCSYDDVTNTTVCSGSGSIPRLDIDSWGNAPTNSSTSGKLLKSITVKDLGSVSTTEQLTFTFDYEYYDATQEITLPFGYTAADVGTTHKKRLKLKYINYPGGDKHTFNYENENATPLPSRFTYSIDHWGYRNHFQAITSNYGYIGRDELSSCGTDRQPDIQYAKDQMLSRISHNTGSEVYLEYELNQAKNYTGAVGGLRIKSITSKDDIRAQSIKKNYSYTLADNSSSGFLFIKPIYRINYFGLDGSNYTLSNLYDYLYAESGRPIVGYSRVTETTTTLADGNFTGKIITYFDQEETEGTIKTNPSCTSGCQFSPMYFNLRQPDLRSGQILRTEVFNQNNVIVQETQNVYTPSGGFSVGATYSVQRHPKSGSDWYYYLYFKKFRLESQKNTTYSPSGGTGVESTVSYTYKDEMPAAYRNKYKGQHNLPVLTTTEDEDGRVLESRILYTADFNFNVDTIQVCSEVYQCPEAPMHCPDLYCIENQYIINVPAYGYEGRGIYESLEKNILTTPIESRQLIDGQTVSATYASLYSQNNNTITLPHKVYSIKQVPRSSFQEAEYQSGNIQLSKDSGYGSEAEAEILTYNARGLAIDSKIRKGSVNRTNYITPVIPEGNTANYGRPDALTSSRTVSKKYLGADKEVSPNQLELKVVYDESSGRVLRELDKDNRVVSRYEYHTVPNTSSIISWNEGSYSKSCSGGFVTVFLHVSGISTPSIAQFSTDGGTTWQNANIGSTGFWYSQAAGTGLKEFRARPSNNHSDVIITHKDISCDPVPFGWDHYNVSKSTSGFCYYDLKVTGLSIGGTAQFSFDGGGGFVDATPSNDALLFHLPRWPPTMTFNARDSNNPSNVISVTVNVCEP